MNIAEIDGSLQALVEGSDADIRFRLARQLNVAARGNWTAQRRDWFSKPTTTTALLHVLAEADDKTSAEIIGTLGAAGQRYEIRDERVLAEFDRRFDAASDVVKLAIVQAVAHFATPRAWQMITAGLRCRPPRKAHFAVGLSTGRYGRHITTHERPSLEKGLLLACGGEKNSNSLHALLGGLGAIGTRAAVEYLQSLKATATNAIVQDDIDQAIAGCRTRL